MPFTVTINIGETKQIDVNGDGTNDIAVYLQKIDLGKAYLTFSAITPSQPSQPSQPVQANQTVQQPVTQPPAQEQPVAQPVAQPVTQQITTENQQQSDAVMAIAVAALAVLGVILFKAASMRKIGRKHKR